MSALWLRSGYAGVLEMAQKVIEGGVVTWRHMHEILRWLNFKLAQNLRSRVKTPRWLTFSDLKLWDGSKFEPINISNWVSLKIRLETVITCQNLMQLSPRDITSFGDFFEQVFDGSSKWFWILNLIWWIFMINDHARQI